MIKIVSVWLWILLQLEFSHFWSNLLPRPGDVLSWSHIWIIIHACLFSLLKINLYQVYVSTWIRCIYLNWQWQTQLYASIYFFFQIKGHSPFNDDLWNLSLCTKILDLGPLHLWAMWPLGLEYLIVIKATFPVVWIKSKRVTPVCYLYSQSSVVMLIPIYIEHGDSVAL